MRALYPILSGQCSVVPGVRALLATVVLTFGVAAPAQAAVSMDPLKLCYVSDGDLPSQREAIHVHASGFTPTGHLTLTIDSQTVDTGRADAFGMATAVVPAPFQGFGERPFTLVVSEAENPQNVASGTSRVTNLGVTLKPKRARPSRRIRFSGRGFTNLAPIYGHYLFGGKVRRTVRFANAPSSPCGTFRARRKQIPVKRPEPGDWLLQVDQQRRYSPTPGSNAQRVVIRVTETF